MPNRELNTLMRTFVHADGPWAKCNRCEDAFWGLFRDDAVILAKAQKHMAKVHAPKPQADQPAVAAPKALRAPRNPAPTHEPNTSDIARIAAEAPVDQDALLDQAIRDLEIGLAA